MAKIIGRSGVVKVGSNTVAGVNGFSMDGSMTPVDNSDLNDQEMVYVAGDITRTAQVNCKWDKADAVGQGALVEGAEVTLVLQPEGDASGNETRTMTALVTGVSEANAKGAMVTKDVSFQISGAVTIGAVV